jgi:hypothetical protein
VFFDRKPHKNTGGLLCFLEYTGEAPRLLSAPLCFVEFSLQNAFMGYKSPFFCAFALQQNSYSHTQSLIVWEFVMDLSFATAVRNASNAWGNNRVTDAATMAELTKRQFNQQELNKALSGPTAGQMAVIQPELARYGQVGTRLNLFA